MARGDMILEHYIIIIIWIIGGDYQISSIQAWDRVRNRREGQFNDFSGRAVMLLFFLFWPFICIHGMILRMRARR